MDPTTTTQAAVGVSELIAGGGIAISGAVVFKLIDLGAKMWASRNQKSTIGPQPFEVKAMEKYVKCSECIEHRRIIESRQSEISEVVRSERRALAETLTGIRKQLNKLDEKAEERSQNLHRRIDPIIDAVGVLKGRVDDHVKTPHAHQ